MICEYSRFSITITTTGFPDVAREANEPPLQTATPRASAATIRRSFMPIDSPPLWIGCLRHRMGASDPRGPGADEHLLNARRRYVAGSLRALARSLPVPRESERAPRFRRVRCVWQCPWQGWAESRLLR